MQETTLSDEERAYLLKLARQAITARLTGEASDLPEIQQIPFEHLRQPGASFVTLTVGGELRGCIGALEPYQPLAQDVYEHALAAAFSDYRFLPVTLEEIKGLEIEISRLSRPEILDYQSPAELLEKLRPGIDGVTIRDGRRRATFLPQVWEKLPDGGEFLAHLCAKMGMAPDLWLRKKLTVEIYQVEEFHESSEANPL
jgi:AmmeMemoRadiSam system protein A